MAMFRALQIEWGLNQLKSHYSPNWYHVYRAARVPRIEWRRADRLWRTAYAAEKPPLLPGARKIVRILGRKFVLGLVTSGSRSRVRRQLREFGLAKYFSACVYSEDATRKKPHPAALNWAMKCLDAGSEDCVYVGDSAEDIEMARRARVRPIGVLGPFPTAARIRAARPDLLLRSISELPHYLRPAESKS